MRSAVKNSEFTGAKRIIHHLPSTLPKTPMTSPTMPDTLNVPAAYKSRKSCVSSVTHIGLPVFMDVFESSSSGWLGSPLVADMPILNAGAGQPSGVNYYRGLANGIERKKAYIGPVCKRDHIRNWVFLLLPARWS